MTPTQHLEWASARLPPWVALILVLLLAWLLADLVWTLWPRNEQPSVAAVGPAASPAVSSRPGRVNTSVIVGANLFGAYQTTDQPVQPTEVVEAPETRLKLVLKGTVADREQSRAFAIIGESGGSGDKVYWVGDSLPGNASLYSVHADRVLLRRAGKFETLTLKTLLDKKSGSQTRTAARTTRSTSGTQGMRALRQQLMTNPAQITDIIRPQPVFANGQQLGYRVYPGRDRQKFVQLGLRPGDLVTEINGNALNDPSQGQQLLKQITESDVINLTVQRSGQTQTLTLRMDE